MTTPTPNASHNPAPDRDPDPAPNPDADPDQASPAVAVTPPTDENAAPNPASEAHTAPNADPLNALGPTPVRAGIPRSDAPGVRSRNAAASSDPNAVPEEVKRRFVQVRGTYYFPDGARAFSDEGKRLTTPSENTEVIRTLVLIAHARGWQEITVAGTERFRKEAWHAAKLLQMNVQGYSSNEIETIQLSGKVRGTRRSEDEKRDLEDGKGDLEDSKRAPETHFAAPVADVPDRAEAAPARASKRAHQVARQAPLIVGRLIEHGPARYRNSQDNEPSYFVRLETPTGERILWGVDFERAIRESQSKVRIDDTVGIRAVRREAVTVRRHARTADGEEAEPEEIRVHRNRWIVEKLEFLDQRREAAGLFMNPDVKPASAQMRFPELVSTYLQLRGAEEIAARRIRDSQDRKRFVDLVREALADQVSRVERLPGVRLRTETNSVSEKIDRAALPVVPRDEDLAPVPG